MIYVRLFYEFFKIGLFAIGGGLATLPFLEKLSTATGWFTRSDLVTMIAVSEATPGPIGINVATYTGFTAAGVLGSIVSTLGIVCPAIILATLVAKFSHKYADHWSVQGAFVGIRPASVAMIAASAIGVAQITIVNLSAAFSWAFPWRLFEWKTLALSIAAFVLLTIKMKRRSHPMAFIACGAIAGIIIQL
ncbi:hypothetical protein FACS18948_5530 [Clostridia bacterium]|nr:hypothetical protein FACS18948_5530 [Clostridia bacterium]